ncbi:hypothetical protein Hypma_004593 [Hypsizygus marmoreus]|uniref:Uncharacterized protein n=1 Tax=Hypsizygus marmoreus TaxID=39966 RepID=A0A369K0M3_HYPMA|nr:hypothetical protein Hypma_004593 [Hypsizygus marmoreus]
MAGNAMFSSNVALLLRTRTILMATQRRAKRPPLRPDTVRAARNSNEDNNTTGRQPEKIFAVVLLCILVFAPMFSISGVALDRHLRSKYYTDMREQWSLEKQQHNIAQRKWHSKEAQWRLAEAEHIARREKYIREEGEARERIRQWDEELRQKKAAWDRELQQKKEGWERELREKQEQERRTREAMRLYWSNVKGSERCEENGVMAYSGRLENLLPTIDAIEACKATSVTIHGVTYPSPSYCEDRGYGDIIGHWVVKNEAVCSTYWEYFKDKANLKYSSIVLVSMLNPPYQTGMHHTGIWLSITNRSLQRIEAPLGGLRSGDNPERMCFTTPATMYGQYFERPTSCPEWGKYGYWGIWNIPDDGCR